MKQLTEQTKYNRTVCRMSMKTLILNEKFTNKRGNLKYPRQWEHKTNNVFIRNQLQIAILDYSPHCPLSPCWEVSLIDFCLKYRPEKLFSSIRFRMGCGSMIWSSILICVTRLSLATRWDSGGISLRLLRMRSTVGALVSS